MDDHPHPEQQHVAKYKSIVNLQDMIVRVFDVTDVTSRNPKFKTIKAAKLPVGAGFSDNEDEVVVLMRGNTRLLTLHLNWVAVTLVSARARARFWG